ncbi:hypothetical protein JOE59_001148 [Agromyces cerinus]|uniref:DUF4166 domain-containing protein n=1 Tax=Agromyces cerinus TaxID=33878 RepID=UPI00195A3F54|nr:DUF4166 domain-containing protein [Agromyces cerinus]MBM7830443.1 hypothetical protein [Agromyces cerinus]
MSTQQPQQGAGSAPSTDAAPPLSPYAQALGGAVSELHPGLQCYFSEVPDGAVGRGRGTFEVVGTPRRWLWPLLSVLGRWGVLFPVHEVEVPFAVENRRSSTGVLHAVRRFEFRSGSREMTDAVHFRNGRVIDVLGVGGRLRVAFDATVREGALVLSSTSVGLRAGRVRLRIPTAVAPRARVVERFDGVTGRQSVRFTLDAPLLGRIYEYAGSFVYEIEQETPA